MPQEQQYDFSGLSQEDLVTLKLLRQQNPTGDPASLIAQLKAAKAEKPAKTPGDSPLDAPGLPLIGSGPMASALKYMEATGGQPPSWLNRAMAGSVGTLGATATGLGPFASLLLGGAPLAAVPPKDAKEGTLDAIGLLAGGAMGPAEKMLSGQSLLQRTFGRTLLGGGAAATDSAARQVMGMPDQNAGQTMAYGAGGTALLGGLGDRIVNSPGLALQKVKGAVNRFVESLVPGARIHPELMTQDSTTPLTPIYQQLQTQFEKAQPGVSQAKQEIARVQRAQAEIGVGRTAAQQTRARITAPLDKADIQDGVELRQLKNLMALHRTGYDGHIDQNGAIVKDGLFGATQLPTGEIVLDSDMAASSKKEAVSNLLTKISEVDQRRAQRAMERVVNAPGANKPLQTVAGNLSQIDKRLAQLKVENVDARTQDLFDRLTSKVATQVFPDSHLVDLADSADVYDFKQKLLDPGSSGTGRVAALMEHLKDSPTDAMVLRQSLLKELLSRAYDGQTQTISGLMGLMRGQNGAPGVFSADKIKALYGGGPDGDAAVQRFGQAITDLNTIAASKDAQSLKNWGKRAVTYGIAALPGGLMGYHSGWMRVLALEAGGTVALLAGEKLLDKAVTSPTIGTALHKWAAQGGGSKALMGFPELRQWLDRNSTPLD